MEIITYAASGFIALSALSLFLNGANVKFSFNIFKTAEGEMKIKSSGLIDKIRKLKKSDTENKIDVEECQRKLENSKEKLQIKRKKKKKH